MNDFLSAELEKLGPPRSIDEILQQPIRSGPFCGDANFGIAIGLASTLPARPLSEVAPHILAQERKDTALWPYLFRLWPDWKWGRQPTGDCTRWMKQHELDVLYACLHAAGKIDAPDALVAGEAIYALGKCELVDSYRYHGAGATGWAVGKAVKELGHLWRKRYEVDGKSWDLSSETKYSIEWGDRGRGLPDPLEPLAAENRAEDLVEAKTPEEAGLLVQAGYPVDYCGYTYWGVARGADGIGSRFDAGWHAMTATGVLWDGDQVRALWIGNTGHGRHNSGETGPIPVPDVYAECGGWVPRRLLAPVYAAGDCYAHTLIGTLVLPLPPWEEALPWM